MSIVDMNIIRTADRAIQYLLLMLIKLERYLVPFTTATGSGFKLLMIVQEMPECIPPHTIVMFLRRQTIKSSVFAFSIRSHRQFGRAV